MTPDNEKQLKQAFLKTLKPILPYLTQDDICVCMFMANKDHNGNMERLRSKGYNLSRDVMTSVGFHKKALSCSGIRSLAKALTEATNTWAHPMDSSFGYFDTPEKFEKDLSEFSDGIRAALSKKLKV